MANVLPNSREQTIQWFADRIDTWAAKAASIGLTVPQITALATMLAAAEGSQSTAIAARIASKDATVNFHTDTDTLKSYGADLIKVIKAFAESTGDPSVYAAASVPPPAPPTPAGAPVQPTELTATLLPGGSLRLGWKGTVSQSAYFSIFRKAEGEAVFTLLDSTDEKFFDDDAIPVGANSLVYYIEARRDEFRVDSNHFLISFGATGATTLALAA